MTGVNRLPTGNPPGWYPDPWQGGRAQRYWDGRQWTSMTAPNEPGAPPPQTATATRGRPRRLGRILTLSAAGFMLAVLVITYALIRGQDIKRVSPTGDIEFYSSGAAKLGSEQIEQQQESMEQRLSELEQQARESGGSTPSPDVVSIAGTWFGANALRYDIRQYGSTAVIQEITAYGVTATGYGEVDAAGAVFAYQSIDGSTGVAYLELVAPDRLEGRFDNNTYGTSIYAVLAR